MDGISDNVCTEGRRVRGENEGDTSDICPLGGRISGEPDSEYEYTEDGGRCGGWLKVSTPSAKNSGDGGDGGAAVLVVPSVLMS